MKFLDRLGWRAWLQRLGDSNLDVGLILILLLQGAVLMYRLADPPGSLIFDETYYVQDARVILGLAVTPEGLPGENLHSGCDPNSEHPPLAKLIMAAGISLFSSDATGWRLPSVVLGVLGVLGVYSILRGLGAGRAQARLGAFLLAFDNLYFVHSRIATLDIYMVSLAILGTWLYLRGRYEFAGLAFGLSTVCKINGLLGVFAIFLYECGRWLVPDEGKPRKLATTPLVLLVVFWLSFGYATLGAMDRYYTEFSGPVSHVLHIFKFGTSLSRAVGVGPQGAESTPLQWWVNEKNFDYLTVSQGNNEISTTTVRFRGCMSIYLIAAAPFALIHCFFQARRGNRIALLVCCLFVANYVPMFFTWLKARRICYLFYMLPSLPSIAMGLSEICRTLPSWVGRAMMMATLYSFVSYFPFPLL